MSSLYTRSKEYTRSRKAQSDSPPSSPSPIAKTLRVSSFFLSVLHGTCSERRPVAVVCCLTLGDLGLWFALERGWFKRNLGRCLCSNRFSVSALALGLFAEMAAGSCCGGRFPSISQKHRSPGQLLLAENLTRENEAKPDQLVKLRSFHK